MYVYLSPSRPFWGIPETNITIMRSSPFYKISDEELAELTPDQKKILDTAIAQGTLTVVNEAFVPKGDAGSSDHILNLSPSEIQRKFVSRMSLAKDIDGLSKLLEGEKARPTPRTQVVNMLSFALDRIYENNPEERFYRAIEVLEEVIEDGTTKEPIAPKKTTKRMARVASTANLTLGDNQ